MVLLVGGILLLWTWENAHSELILCVFLSGFSCGLFCFLFAFLRDSFVLIARYLAGMCVLQDFFVALRGVGKRLSQAMPCIA